MINEEYTQTQIEGIRKFLRERAREFQEKWPEYENEERTLLRLLQYI